MPGRAEKMQSYTPTQKGAEFQAAAEHNPQEVEAREPEVRQVEEEHRKALEEEEMEQVGQAERLEEEHDPSPEEQDQDWREQRAQKEAASMLGGHPQAEVQTPTLSPWGWETWLCFSIVKTNPCVLQCL